MLKNESSHLKCASWREYQLFTLSNDNGVQVDISNLGATIVNLYLVNKAGIKINIVLGYDSPQEYLHGDSFLGSVVGPWANRIDQAQFELAGEKINVDKNEGNNHLHGGACAIHKKTWLLADSSTTSVALKTSIAYREGGFPAQMELSVIYSLNNDNELSVDYTAIVDRPTPVNLTQHTYFNLDGEGNILDHRLVINADEYLETDNFSIPIKRATVKNTAMDFRNPKILRKDLIEQPSEIKRTKGFDHCYCIDLHGMQLASTVYSEKSGILMKVFTDQCGLQFYTGNFLKDVIGRNEQYYQQYSGLCLETQHYPNQINMNEYKEHCVYSPKRPYKHKTIFQFILNENNH